MKGAMRCVITLGWIVAGYCPAGCLQGAGDALEEGASSLKAISTVWTQPLDGRGIVAVDSAGNSLVAEPADGVIAVAKVSPGGAVLWSAEVPGTEQPAAIAVDRRDDVVVTGGSLMAKLSGAGTLLWSITLASPVDQFWAVGSIAIGPQDEITVAELAGWGESLVLETYAPTGDLLRSREYGVETGWFNSARALTDAAGNVVVVGTHNGGGALDFGGGPLTTTATGYTMFLFKLTADGRHVFSKRFATDDVEIWWNTGAIDARGNILVTGIVDGTGPISLGNKSLTLADWTTADCMFVAKFSPTGVTSFAKLFAGDAATAYAYAIAADARNNIAIVGTYQGSPGSHPLNFGGGALPQSTGVYGDAFVLSLSSGGGYRSGGLVPAYGEALSVGVDRTRRDLRVTMDQSLARMTP